MMKLERGGGQKEGGERETEERRDKGGEGGRESSEKLFCLNPLTYWLHGVEEMCDERSPRPKTLLCSGQCCHRVAKRHHNPLLPGQPLDGLLCSRQLWSQSDDTNIVQGAVDLTQSTGREVGHYERL